MHYPFWDTSVGYGILMAAIAIIHVFVSHFAIGGGLYLVIAEHGARRARDEESLAYLQRLSRFFALLTLVFGALTGVGIWFIIGLVGPAATEALIHNFVWGWAIEWTFFLVEIVAAILYYYGWKSMSARRHLTLGWIYFAAAWLSLFVINGILTFMLTPGRWLETGDFWDGFFNPTMWPSLVFRTGICILLAGLYATLVASRYPAGAFKARRIRYNSVWGLIGLALMVPSFYWYWRAIPDTVRAAARDLLVMPLPSVRLAAACAAFLAAGLILFGLIAARRMHVALASLLMLAGLALFSGFEMFRESVRKPYVLWGYMYGNGIDVARVDTLRKEGLLPNLAYRSGDDGADLFRHACRSCHTWSGYKPLKPAFDGTDPAFIAAIVRHVDTLKGHMPPFPGTDAEAAILAGHIHKLTDPRPLGEIYGLAGADLGRKVWDIRCGTCHEFGGYKDKTATLKDMSADDLSTLLDMAGDIDPAMPPFTGDATERKALIDYLTTLGGTR